MLSPWPDGSASKPERAETVEPRAPVPLWHTLLLPLVLGGTAFCHASALRSYLSGEDFLDLYQKGSLPFWDWVLLLRDGRLQPLGKLSFAFLHLAVDLASPRFTSLSLLVHAINAMLLQGLVGRLSGRPLLGFAVAIAWGTAPIHQGVLGQALGLASTLAILCLGVVWIGLVAAADRDRAPSPVRLLGWTLLGSGAAAAVGAALGAAIGLPIAAGLVLTPRSGRLRSVVVLSVVAALAATLTWWVVRLEGLGSRHEVLSLLSALAGYGTAALVAGQLLSVTARDVTAGLGLTVDEAVRASVPVALVLLAGVCALVVVARRQHESLRRLAALVVVTLLSYGAVALTGPGPGPLPGWIAWTATRPVLHYVPTFFLAAAIGQALALVDLRRPVPRWALALAGVVALLVVVRRREVAELFESRQNAADLRATERTLRELSDRFSAVAPNERPYVYNTAFSPVGSAMWHTDDAADFPGLAALYTIAYYPFGRGEDALEPRFVEPDTYFVRRLRAEHPTSPVTRLIVTPAEADAAGARVLGYPRETTPLLEALRLSSDVAAALIASRDPRVRAALKKRYQR